MPKHEQVPKSRMDVAKELYDAYAAEVGGTTFDGKPLPQFHELGERQKKGWVAAALSACNAIFNPMKDVGK